MFNITNCEENANQKPQWDIISHLLKWLSLKRQETTNVGQDVEKRESLYYANGTVNWWTHCGEHYGDFWKQKQLNNTTVWLSYSPLTDIKTPIEKIYIYIYTHTHSQVLLYYCIHFTAVLFTVANIWKQLSIDEWTKIQHKYI